MQIIDKKTPEIGESLTLMERLKRYIEPVDKKWSQRIKSADVKDSCNSRKWRSKISKNRRTSCFIDKS